ncbi:unnamed protein product [Orchesella dallaii]|uniref:MICOS complex subunit MIC13 n=1 Tax=Orchesella dallaii TaxID=48710 RepID=A0ABP1RXL9_9HEXA
MALRKMGSLIRISTKAGLAGGTVYLYYEAGLWKGTDETIDNYEKLRKDAEVVYNANPDVKKWLEYVSSSVSSNVKPYSDAITNFRKEWLNVDLSTVSSPINGVVKPVWNKGVTWTIEAIADSPETIQRLSSTGWEKLKELSMEPQGSPPKPDSSSKSAKQ